MSETVSAKFAAGSRNFLASGYRAITIMPMMRGSEAIGALSVVRLAPGPLSEKTAGGVKNVRRAGRHRHREYKALNELRETLDRQMATSEVLGVISSSPGELQPVFDAMLQCHTYLRSNIGQLVPVQRGRVPRRGRAWKFLLCRLVAAGARLEYAHRSA